MCHHHVGCLDNTHIKPQVFFLQNHLWRLCGRLWFLRYGEKAALGNWKLIPAFPTPNFLNLPLEQVQFH